MTIFELGAIEKSAITYGIVFGVLLIVYGFFYRVAGLERIPGFTAPFYLALPLCAYLTVRALPSPENPLTFRGASVPGVVASVLAAGIYCIFVFFYNAYVDDSLLQQLVQNSVAAWQAQDVPQSTIDERLTSFSFTPAGFALTIFILMSLVSIVGGLIVGWIVVRKQDG